MPITYLSIQTALIQNPTGFFASLKPADIKVMISLFLIQFSQEVLKPYQVQNIIIYAQKSDLLKVLFGVISQAQYQQRLSLMNMTYSQLQNFTQNLTQTQVLQMQTNLILLPLDDLKSIYQGIPDTQIQQLFKSLSPEQLALVVSMVVKLSQRQLEVIANSINNVKVVIENYIGVL